MMTDREIQERVVKILTPYAKNGEALANVSAESHILDDLEVNSARLVDAACTAVLVIKNFLSATFTAITRLRARKFSNPEDARVFADGADPAEGETDAVARALRIQRNDGENLPAFFAIGLVYVLVGASPFGAAVYFWTFTSARILHTLAYTMGLQPWRTLLFTVSAACLLGMSAQVLMAVLG